MKRTLALAILAFACKKDAAPAPVSTKVDDAAPPAERVRLDPEAPPSGDARAKAAAVFDGWPLLLSPADDDSVLCAQLGAGAGTVDLGSCGFREDEVAIEYGEGGASRDEAIDELARRLPICGPDAVLLARVRLPPPGAQPPPTIEIPAWSHLLRAEKDGLSIWWAEPDGAMDGFDIPPDRIEALHATGDGRLVIVRARAEDGSSTCSATRRVPQRGGGGSTSR